MFLIYENATVERKDNNTTKGRTFVFDKPTNVKYANQSYEGYDRVHFHVKRGGKVYADDHPVKILKED